MPISINNEFETGSIIALGTSTPPIGFLSCNGTAVSRTGFPLLFAKMPFNTISIAAASMFTISSTTVTCASHGMSTGHTIQFSTTGALPTGITTGTIYYVRVLTVNTFELYPTLIQAITTSATTGRITPTGVQSGTHTATVYYYGNGDGSTTFNIPDLQGSVIRGVGTTIGYIQNVTITPGAKTDDASQAHGHTFVGSFNPSSIGANFVQMTGANDQPGLSTGSIAASGGNGTPRVTNETRVKSIGFYYHIKY